MEQNENIGFLNRKKQGFERNRNICAMVTAVMVWNIWQAYDTGAPEWWFPLVMGALTAIAVGILIYDLLQIKKISAELASLESAVAENAADSAGVTENAAETAATEDTERAESSTQ